MKIILWSLLGLVLIGNAFFVLPWHFSADTLTVGYDIHFKKDSLLLRNIFPDSTIQVRLNLPVLYKKWYTANQPDKSSYILVNVAVLHNLDFTALAFPFYKVTTFKSNIPFYSIIRASNAPDMDSTVLIGNITLDGKVSVKGICSPLYARTLVEKELVTVLAKEMGKIEMDINRPPVPDTVTTIPALATPTPLLPVKKKR